MKAKQKIGIGTAFPDVFTEIGYTDGSLFIRSDLPGFPVYQLELKKQTSNWRRILGVDIVMTTTIDQIVSEYFEIEQFADGYFLSLADENVLEDIRNEMKWLPKVALADFKLLPGIYDIKIKSAIKLLDLYPDGEFEANEYMVARSENCKIDISASFGVSLIGVWSKSIFVGEADARIRYNENDLIKL